MGSVAKRSCARGRQCTQYRFLGEPARVRRSSQSDLCEICAQEGRSRGSASLEDAPEEHRGVLQAAQALLRGETTNKVLKSELADERNIAPTLVFAALSRTYPELRSTRDRFVEVGEGTEGWTRLDSELFLNRFERLMPLGLLDDGTLVLRHPPVAGTELLDDTGCVKEFQLDIYTPPKVTKDEVVAFYERCLRRRELPYVPGRGDLGMRKLKDSVRILARPESTSNGPVLTSGQGALPAPKAVGAIYQYLRTVHSEGTKKTETKKPYNLIPACVYWYLGNRGAVLDSEERELKKTTRGLVENYVVEPCKDKFPEEEKIRKDWIRTTQRVILSK
jgi:hypothetical protein